MGERGIKTSEDAGIDQTTKKVGMWASHDPPEACLSSSNYDLDKLKQAFSQTFSFFCFNILNIYSHDGSESNESEFYIFILPFLNS